MPWLGCAAAAVVLCSVDPDGDWTASGKGQQAAESLKPTNQKPQAKLEAICDNLQFFFSLQCSNLKKFLNVTIGISFNSK